jgi:hypothetical protein
MLFPRSASADFFYPSARADITESTNRSALQSRVQPLFDSPEVWFPPH